MTCCPEPDSTSAWLGLDLTARQSSLQLTARRGGQWSGCDCFPVDRHWHLAILLLGLWVLLHLSVWLSCCSRQRPPGVSVVPHWLAHLPALCSRPNPNSRVPGRLHRLPFVDTALDSCWCGGGTYPKSEGFRGQLVSRPTRKWSHRTANVLVQGLLLPGCMALCEVLALSEPLISHLHNGL